VHPFQQVRGHQVLEAGPCLRHDRPIDVVVLLFLLHGADPGVSKWRQPEDGVETLEHLDPAGDGLVADLQVLAQRVD